MVIIILKHVLHIKPRKMIFLFYKHFIAIFLLSLSNSNIPNCNKIISHKMFNLKINFKVILLVLTICF